jgi:hypothetical protein
MVMTIGKCPICSRLDAESQFIINQANPYDSKTYYRCPRCLEFVIENKLIDGPQDPAGTKLIPYLSSYVRRNQSSVQPEITRTNWKESALAEKSVTVPQKLERLLQFIADRTSVPGELVHIDRDIDAPLFNALTENEVNYLLSCLQDGQLVELSGSVDAKMKVKGWQQLISPLDGGGIPGRCFIAMSFNPKLRDIWELAIKPAVEACGFVAIRIDKKAHNKDINEEILAEVKKSQFVIADFTEHKAGVYFEAGFARGLGREVIWSCRKSDFEDAHFDTNHYSHIVWEDIPDFRKQLIDRILATIPNARAVQ